MEEEIDILPEEELLEALEIDPTIQVQENSTTKQKALSKFKSKYHKSPEHERLAKQQSIFSSLSNYLELCVASGMLNRGFGTVINYRYKYKKNSELLDIRLYNILLHGFSAKGNYSRVKEIMSIIRDDKIKYNSQTYAAALECLGRLEDSAVNNELIATWLNDAQANQITLNDIMDKSQFVGDQREMVLDTIQKIFPEFQPIYTPPILKYSNELVNSLNKNVRPVEYDLSKLKNADKGSEIMNAKRGFSKKKLEELAREQLSVELESVITVKSIAKFAEPTETVLHYRTKLNDLQDLWRTQICVAFNRDLNTLRHQTHSKASRAVNLLPYLKALEVGKYADILMKEIRTLAEGSETYSPTVGHLYKDLGSRVQSRYHMEMKKENGILEKTGEIYGMYCDEISRSVTSDNPRQSWQRLVHQTRHSGPSMDVNDKAWPMSVMIGIGRFLYNILMRDIKIDANVCRTNSKTQNIMPAFYTLFRNQGRIVKEEVKPHPILSRLFRGSQQQTLTFDANLVPMLCPPQPWSTPVNGGYLLAKSDLIRLPQQAIQQWARINESANSDMYPSLDSLNQLASVPWKVNTNVLDVILEVFNNGGSAKLDVPQPPHALPPLPKIDKNEDISNVDKFALFRQKLAHRRKQGEMYSLWCDSLYRLSLANHFRDKVFWLPHNMDFRGRVYPLPPHLNHLGSDLARSLLIFNQPQPLGPDGFDWLKLHCINLTGLKKRDSVVDRLLYAEEIMDDILDSAENPLTGRMWWTKSDEPWQTLSCCVEIANVTKSPNPEEFMSCLPIHQDGSCNGLQHYAALGRDTAGAISVNLAPSVIPQDVYSLVAALVEEARLKDSANGIQVAQILENFVKRKVIKQTVMTTVYGVTRYGARLQIARQLKDIDDFPKEWVWPASTYLTTKTFESLREMFTSTKEIQDWFTDCARLISGVCGQNVEWITPLGLKVVQPYNRFEKKTMPKNHTAGEHVSMDLYEKPNVMKQKNAFPPNFIHSLDSSHMMLTSLHSEKAGLTFISVHDCYWTHACTVAEMNKVFFLNGYLILLLIINFFFFYRFVANSLLPYILNQF